MKHSAEIGSAVGYWVVLSTASPKNNKSMAFCVCKCGTFKIVQVASLRQGKSMSCGCRQKEVVTAMNLRHGMVGTRIYDIWKNITARCTNAKASYYDRYGGRGITVCEEWKEFNAFHEWATSHGYSENLQIDRIDNDAGYSPSNCRFVTQAINCQNRSSTKLTTSDVISIRNRNGETHTSIASIYGVSRSLIQQIRSFKKWTQMHQM